MVCEDSMVFAPTQAPRDHGTALSNSGVKEFASGRFLLNSRDDVGLVIMSSLAEGDFSRFDPAQPPTFRDTVILSMCLQMKMAGLSI